MIQPPRKISKKIDPHIKGKKGRKTTGSRLMPLGGDSEQKGDYTGGDLPCIVSGESPRLDIPFLGPCTGEMSPLVWLGASWE